LAAFAQIAVGKEKQDNDLLICAVGKEKQDNDLLICAVGKGYLKDSGGGLCEVGLIKMERIWVA